MFGKLAYEFGGARRPVEVLESAAGFYLGTLEDGMPNSRESLEYFPSREAAAAALASGEWNQRDRP